MLCASSIHGKIEITAGRQECFHVTCNEINRTSENAHSVWHLLAPFRLEVCYFPNTCHSVDPGRGFWGLQCFLFCKVLSPSTDIKAKLFSLLSCRFNTSPACGKHGQTTETCVPNHKGFHQSSGIKTFRWRLMSLHLSGDWHLKRRHKSSLGLRLGWRNGWKSLSLPFKSEWLNRVRTEFSKGFSHPILILYTQVCIMWARCLTSVSGQWWYS